MSSETLSASPAPPRGRMKRLDPAWYRGTTFVFWTYTMRDRRTGWLDDKFHSAFREIKLHALTRYQMACLSYCLMPDHMHFLWAGLSPDSDQDRAGAFFHKYLGRHLTPRGFELQRQTWDVVLRDKERERGALNATIFYIAENPVRKNLTGNARNWPWSGSQVPGYPELDWRTDDFTDRFWKIYALEVRRFSRRA